MGELKITLKDWVGVFLTGISFSTLLTLLAYGLLGLSLYAGTFYGILLGFCIALFSVLLVKGMNHYLLPRLSHRWWDIIAALFSFLAGFLGSLISYIAFKLLHCEAMLVPMVAMHPLWSSMILGVLTYLLGRLMYRFVKARNEKEQSEALLVQSRLRSLETQLNPHFLFNALNSLTEMVHHDPKKAEDAIIKLSMFLRSTMEEKPLIPLSEELKNVQWYIELERLRFPTLRLILETPTPTLHRLVPKFSIQLLVENAIKHGFDASLPSFEINVQTALTHQLEIRVCNNGKAVVQEHFGIGLTNLKERLAVLCGGSVTLLSKEPVSYQITLKECHENFSR